MNNAPIIFVYLIFILAIVGWIFSELISKKTKEIESQYIKRLNQLNKERTKLEALLVKEKNRCTQVKEKSVPLREFESSIPTMEKNHTNLSALLDKYYVNVDLLRAKLNKREFSSNSVANEVLIIIEEFCPNEQERLKHKQNKLSGAFTRIKKSMESSQHA